MKFTTPFGINFRIYDLIFPSIFLVFVSSSHEIFFFMLVFGVLRLIISLEEPVVFVLKGKRNTVIIIMCDTLECCLMLKHVLTGQCVNCT